MRSNQWNIFIVKWKITKYSDVGWGAESTVDKVLCHAGVVTDIRLANLNIPGIVTHIKSQVTNICITYTILLYV